MAEEISVVLIDDHPLFRQGVADTFSLEPDIRVVGQASSGENGIELIRHKAPKVAIVDVNMPDMNGQQVTRQVIAEGLETRVILLTAYDDIEQKIHSVRVGAAAYCTKEIQPEKLIETIHHVANGKFVIEGRVLDAAELDEWLETNVKSTVSLYGDQVEPYQPLSSREMEVLTCVTRGLSNKEIASSLGISHQTVKNHITSILRKLGVEDRTQAALFALRRGWVRLQQEND